VIHDGQSDPVRTVAVPEKPKDVEIAAFKFNATQPNEGIAGASYALFVEHRFPSGYLPPTPPAGVVTPSGMFFFASGSTGHSGKLRFSVPAGYAWCLQELVVPQGYVLDPGLHCTGILTQSSPQVGTLALRETPALPDTGSPLGSIVIIGVVFAGIGFILRRRNYR
jgi:LPXTG-motif cell wall-anchored protein